MFKKLTAKEKYFKEGQNIFSKNKLLPCDFRDNYVFYPFFDKGIFNEFKKYFDECFENSNCTFEFVQVVNSTYDIFIKGNGKIARVEANTKRMYYHPEKIINDLKTMEKLIEEE